MNFFYSYQTDRGTVRTSNQDSLMVKVIQSAGNQAFLAAVCDGVGGLTHGELTSRKTVEMLGKWAEYELPGLLADVADGKVLKKRLQHLLQDINREIYFDNLSGGISSGTTMTALVLYDDHYWAAHVGDSRLYAVTEDGAIRLTEDHSWVEEEILAGRMTREEAEHSPRKNVILKCIGASGEISPQILEGKAEKDTVFVLCSDGFWHDITAKEWAEVFAPENNPESRTLGKNLQQMAEQVKARGESDNITAVAVRIRK